MSKILFCHSKIKFISSRHRVISSTYISQLVRYPTIQSSDCKTDNKQVIWFELIWFPTLSYTRSLKKVPFSGKAFLYRPFEWVPPGKSLYKMSIWKRKASETTADLRISIYLFIYLPAFLNTGLPRGNVHERDSKVPCKVPSLPNPTPTTRKGWPHHRGLRPLIFSNSDVGSFTSHKNRSVRVLWDGTYGFSSLSEKTWKSNHLQMCWGLKCNKWP